MKNNFLINCETVMDTVYMSDKDSSLPPINQIRIALHLLFCTNCAGELRNLHRVEEIMKTDFLAPSPDFEDILMERLYEEADENANFEAKIDAPASFSFRLWVFVGSFVLLSLSSSFFGLNFIEIAAVKGSSFLLPVGITVGVALTCYGAMFIGSHLKELSDRFGL